MSLRPGHPTDRTQSQKDLPCSSGKPISVALYARSPPTCTRVRVGDDESARATLPYLIYPLPTRRSPAAPALRAPAVSVGQVVALATTGHHPGLIALPPIHEECGYGHPRCRGCRAPASSCARHSLYGFSAVRSKSMRSSTGNPSR